MSSGALGPLQLHDAHDASGHIQAEARAVALYVDPREVITAVLRGDGEGDDVGDAQAQLVPDALREAVQRANVFG